MTIVPKRLLLFAFVLIASLQFGRSDVPGEVDFSFGSEPSPVWDLSGGYTLEQPLVGSDQQSLPLVFGISVAHDARGHLSGSGTIEVDYGGSFFAADYVATGSVSGGGDLTRVKLRVRLKGEDFVAGIFTKFSISLSYNLEVNAEAGTLTGTVRGGAGFAALGSGRVNSDISVDLPSGMDGSWSAHLTIAPLNPLAGTGQITLSNHRLLQTTLKGSFKSSLDQTSVRLSGIGDSLGTRVNLKFIQVGDNPAELTDLSGRILGQKVRQ